MSAVEIVICYRAGTQAILDACLTSIERHTSGVDYFVTVLTQTNGLDELLCMCGSDKRPDVEVEEVSIDSQFKTSRTHGAMLDAYVPNRVRAERVLTLDSDCMPIADRWLSGLLDMMDSGARVVGILHPWSPPPEGMPTTRIEWRVRSQHCWETTHVACQMVSVADLRELGVRYNAGDDTGLLIPKKAKEKGWQVGGYKPTRCPKPKMGLVDPEFNRDTCVVYGDKIVHIGGASRVVAGDKPVWGEEFIWAADRIVAERGGEFLLRGDMSYAYAFDREEDVSRERMDRMFGLKKLG